MAAAEELDEGEAVMLAVEYSDAADTVEYSDAVECSETGDAVECTEVTVEWVMYVLVKVVWPYVSVAVTGQ